MKILHFSTFDIEGGAGSAAFQLHESFLKAGLDSLMIVKNKKSKSDTVIVINNSCLSRFLQKIKRNKLTYFVHTKVFHLLKKMGQENILSKFNANKSCLQFEDIKNYLKSADIICLHWIDGFLSTELIRQIQKFSNIPIIWILQDIEPITGGCHYTGGCKGYMKSCGKCPQLKSWQERDESRIIWEQKKNDLEDLNIIIVSPTSWVYDRVKESSLFSKNPNEKILLGVDTRIFKTGEKNIARKKIGLSEDSKIIFFGAQNTNEGRKGMDVFLESIKFLKERIESEHKEMLEKILIVSAGRSPLNRINNHFKYTHLGWISSQEKLAQIFQAADVFACPSIEDAGPVMINQSIACGTPVVSFNMGVAADLITRDDRGYIAKNFDASDFADGLYKLIAKNRFTGNASPNLFECSSEIIAGKYKNLFEKLLKNKL